MSRRGGGGGPPRGGDGPVIKVRGLPYEAVALDLCKFFVDCKIRGGPRGIYFQLNDRKQPTGEAFIELEGNRDVDMALRLNRERMGSRYVEVFESRRSVLEEEIKNGATNEFGFNENRRDRGRLSDRDRSYGRDRDNFGGGNFGGGGFGRGGFGGGGGAFGRDDFRDRSGDRFGGGRGGYGGGFSGGRGGDDFGRNRRNFGGGIRKSGKDLGPPKSEASKHCVKLRGLPWSATKTEIVDFLPDCSILGGTDGVHIIKEDGSDRASGDAYVELETDEDINLAIKQHKKSMGSRYVEVFEANSTDVARAKDREEMRKELQSGYKVLLRGIPYNTTEKDIAEWLSEAGDAIEVFLEEDRRGRPPGNAVAYFKSESEARKVVEEMHKRDMGNRYVECFMEGEEPERRRRRDSS